MYVQSEIKKKAELFYTTLNKHFVIFLSSLHYKSGRLLNISSRKWEKKRVEKREWSERKAACKGGSEATQKKEKKRESRRVVSAIGRTRGAFMTGLVSELRSQYCNKCS